MSENSNSSDILNILSRASDMNSKELEEALNNLEDLGIEPLSGPIMRPGITCPFTEMQVISPCSLKKCNFYVENEWSRNCLLQYMEEQNYEELSSEEIAFLYQTTTEKVEDTIREAMSQLRENSEETVGISGDFSKKEPKKFKISEGSLENLEISNNTLFPPFLEEANKKLFEEATDEEVLNHPAAKLLGILDSIITELE